VALAVLSPSALAQTTSPAESVEDPDDLGLEELLNDVVVTATKTIQRVEEAPAIVTVVTREEIRQWGYRSVAEVLGHVVGFFVLDDHILPNLAVRGVSGGLRAESGIVKVMIDGHSVAFRSTAGNWLGVELVPLSAVERVEILRGPASALYGADAFLGVINVITRSAPQGEPLVGQDLTVDLSRTGDRLGAGHDLAVGARKGAFDVLLSARLDLENRSGLELPESSPAPNLPSFTSGRTASDLTLFSGVGLAKLTYRAGKRAKVALTAYLSALDRGAEFADWLQLGYGLNEQGRLSQNRISLVHGLVNASIALRLSDDVDITLDATTFAGEPTSRDRIDVGSDLYYIRRDFGYRGGEIQLDGRIRLSSTVTLVSGVGLSYDQERPPTNRRILKFATGGLMAGEARQSMSQELATRSLVNPGASAQVLYTPASRALSLTGGVRYDYHNIYGHQVSGRAAAVLSPWKKVNAKLLYGSAFKAPSPVLLYGVPFSSGDIIGNPDLKAQHVHTFEAQVSYAPSEWLTVTSGTAYSLLLNKAEFTQQGVNKVARNVSEVRSLSWETEAKADLRDKLTAYAGLGVDLATRDLGEEGYQATLVGQRNVVYPPVAVHGGIQAVVPRLPLRLGLELSFLSARRASDSNILEHGAPYELGSLYLLGGTLSSVGLHLFPKKATTIMLIGRNLLGTTVADPGFSGVDYPRTPRTVFLQLGQEL
jgi:iron complex outermembrane receptor protein